jgi:hypothetical protein
MSRRMVWSTFNLIVIAGLLAALALPTGTSAQIRTGASLTVLRGVVTLLHSDGRVENPAPTGATLAVDDQVNTLNLAGALITFFDGSEIELGSNTLLIIREMLGQGAVTNITIESVVGASIHNVISLTDPSSSYRVMSGGSLAVVRGTLFGHQTDPGGTVTVALESCGTRAQPAPPRECLEFPAPGLPLQPGQRRTLTDHSTIITDRFTPGGSLFDAVGSPANGPEQPFSPPGGPPGPGGPGGPGGGSGGPGGGPGADAATGGASPGGGAGTAGGTDDGPLALDAAPQTTCTTGDQGQLEIMASKVQVGVDMPLRDILGHTQYCAIPGHEFRFDRFGTVRRAIFGAIPLMPDSPEVTTAGPGTVRGYVIETYAFDGSGQSVKITWRVQSDGDWFHWKDAEVLPPPR